MHIMNIIIMNMIVHVIMHITTVVFTLLCMVLANIVHMRVDTILVMALYYARVCSYYVRGYAHALGVMLTLQWPACGNAAAS